MKGSAVEIIQQETVGNSTGDRISTEGIMNAMKIRVIVANRSAASRDGRPGDPD